ncbi:MAG: lasso peptide biosynthesis B2 protein [Phycisphaerae bacterium]
MILRAFLRAHIWTLSGVVPLLVRLISLERLVRLLTPRFRPYRSIPDSEMVELVRRRLRRPRNMKRRRCLRLGLTLYHFLRLSGREAVIRFAVYPGLSNDRMHAHCWVTLGGLCVSEPPAAAAVEVFRYPEPAGTDCRNAASAA